MSFEVIMHDMLIVSVPTVAALFGILLNRQDATTIRTEMANLRNEMKAGITQLRNEVKGDINSLRSETIALRDSIHRDMIGLHKRLVIVESKQNS